MFLSLAVIEFACPEKNEADHNIQLAVHYNNKTNLRDLKAATGL